MAIKTMAAGGSAGRSLNLVGLMSGTSADGIDAVAATIQRRGTRLVATVLAHHQAPYPAPLRQQLLHVALHGNVNEICELNFFLGELFARAALRVIKDAKLAPRQVAAIGSHGQTIHHLPNARHPSTLQIGEAAVIAERTGITTVSDFRVADVAAGGQGAPLVPFADWALFGHPRRPRIIQNIGGIGNLTFLAPGGPLEHVVAFDTGPGNMVIDAAVAHLTAGRAAFDRNGRMAASGRVCEGLLRSLQRHPFIRRKPPKTTGREEFGEAFMGQVLATAARHRLQAADVVATITDFTAWSIAEAYRRFIFPRLRAGSQAAQVVVGGGGAKNPTLLTMLAARLPEAEIVTHEALGIASEAKEALAFAILAHETLHGRPSNVPSATGAAHPVVLGKINSPGVRS